MTNNENIVDPQSVKNNLLVIHEELKELHNQQQDAFNLIYNKLNWIMVSDFVFFAAVLSLRREHFFVLLAIFASIIISLFGLKSETFRITKKISKMLDEVNIDSDEFLKALIDKKLKAFYFNDSISKNARNALLYSKIFLAVAIILLLFSIVSNYCFYNLLINFI